MEAWGFRHNRSIASATVQVLWGALGCFGALSGRGSCITANQKSLWTPEMHPFSASTLPAPSDVRPPTSNTPPNAANRNVASCQATSRARWLRCHPCAALDHTPPTSGFCGSHHTIDEACLRAEPQPSNCSIMALDPAAAAARRSVSPESSGRDSPIPRQWRNQLGGGTELPLVMRGQLY